MPFPEPEAGLVISYGYLWRYEHHKGHKEGRKTRPCVIVLAVEEVNGTKKVTVAPMTHVRPDDPSCAIEIPIRVKQHLGLDDEPSWVIINEVNQFDWPGYDLRPVAHSKTRYDFGFIPPKLFEKIKTGILGLFLDRRVVLTQRD